MADPVWGLLPKAQDNPQTIDEAISAAIAAHESDPEAHLGDGESLEAHRANDVIDHPAQSVVDDKLIVNKFSIECYFENLSVFGQSGLNFSYLGYVELYSTLLNGSGSDLFNPSDDENNLTPNKEENPIFEFVGGFSSIDNYRGYLGMGTMFENDGVGFKVEGNSAYASYFDTDAVEHTIFLSGVNPKTTHKWRVEVVWGDAIYWFVDNVQVASYSLVSNDISLGSGGVMFRLSVTHLGTAHVSKLFGYRVLFQQDLFE